MDRLQQAVYRAVREQHTDLTTEDRAATWAGRQGVDEADFRAAYRSAEVADAVAQAPDLLVRYRITELPTVVVDDASRTSPSAAGDVTAMPEVLDDLIERA
ncbi:DsbA family protein [Kitasatospora sp. HUAS MG31]|uniref:DsbA family protein n=1 Tax=Kitasatospora camelliae TaxID=3156397 RepID=A0AAU8JU34_9ACTN